MRFGSVCSGIEAASVAWGPLGWEAAWLSEIEKFPSELLAQRYPGVKNLGPDSIGVQADIAYTLEARAEVQAVYAVRTAQTSSNGWGVNTHTAYTLDGANGQAVAFAENSRAEVRLEGGDGQIVGTLSTGGGKPGQGTPTIAGDSGVRRLTPEECEALQGFPRGYTAITTNGKPASDSPRYRALGNSMAVSVMHWIGNRISQHLNNKGEN